MNANVQDMRSELRGLDLDLGTESGPGRGVIEPMSVQPRLDLGEDLEDAATMLVAALEARDEQAVRAIVGDSPSDPQSAALRRAAYRCAQQRFYLGEGGRVSEATVFAVPIVVVPTSGGGERMPVIAHGLMPTLQSHLLNAGVVRIPGAKLTVVGRLYSPHELMQTPWVEIYALPEVARESDFPVSPSQTGIPYIGRGYRVRFDSSGGEPMVWFLVGVVEHDEPFTALFLDSASDGGVQNRWRQMARRTMNEVLKRHGIEANVGVGVPAVLYEALSQGVTVWNELRVRKAGARAVNLSAQGGVETTVDPKFDGMGFTVQFWDSRTAKWLAEVRWYCFGEAGRGIDTAQEVMDLLREHRALPAARLSPGYGSNATVSMY